MGHLLDNVKSTFGMDDGTQVGEYVSATRGYFDKAGSYTISIDSGVHAGVQVHVEPDVISIGSGADNEVVLFADNIENKHLELELPAGYLDTIKVLPIEGPVALSDGGVVEVGQIAEIKADSTIIIGETKLNISRVTNPETLMRYGLKAIAILAFILMLPLLYNVFSNLTVGMADAGSRLYAAVDKEISTQSEKYLGVTTDPDMELAKKFTWAVRVQLEDLKLNHLLRAETTADGSIRVYGNISDREVSRWTGFLQWYDTREGFPPLIRDVSRVGVDRDLPKIKSVWLDDEPTAFLTDGSIAKIGSEIAGGWKVVGIDANGVTIERDGSTVSLTY